MANQETMISIDSLSLAEQMEVGMVTRLAWPIPIEQVSQEELMELGLATKASWEAISPTEMQGFGHRREKQLHRKPLASSVVKAADQVDCDEIDWQDVEDPSIRPLNCTELVRSRMGTLSLWLRRRTLTRNEIWSTFKYGYVVV